MTRMWPRPAFQNPKHLKLYSTSLITVRGILGANRDVCPSAGIDAWMTTAGIRPKQFLSSLKGNSGYQYCKKISDIFITTSSKIITKIASLSRHILVWKCRKWIADYIGWINKRCQTSILKFFSEQYHAHCLKHRLFWSEQTWRWVVWRTIWNRLRSITIAVRKIRYVALVFISSSN